MTTTYTPSPARQPRRPLRRGPILLAVAGLTAALLAVGCDTAQQVPWASYSSGLQQRIDSAAATGNCAALAGYLAAAKATGTVHEKATGFPNDALEAYIQAAQAQAGCRTGGS
jgi:hypothetical protein